MATGMETNLAGIGGDEKHCSRGWAAKEKNFAGTGGDGIKSCGDGWGRNQKLRVRVGMGVNCCPSATLYSPVIQLALGWYNMA